MKERYEKSPSPSKSCAVREDNCFCQVLHFQLHEIQGGVQKGNFSSVRSFFSLFMSFFNVYPQNILCRIDSCPKYFLVREPVDPTPWTELLQNTGKSNRSVKRYIGHNFGSHTGKLLKDMKQKGYI